MGGIGCVGGRGCIGDIGGDTGIAVIVVIVVIAGGGSASSSQAMLDPVPLFGALGVVEAV